jgi:mannose-6-phosphate isomerase-like protein (cupin superfamily)
MSDSLQPNTTQRLRVLTSSAEELVLESTWGPGGRRPPTHWHPGQDETFEVVDGALTVVVDGAAPQVLGPGERLDIPRRTAHRMWNAGPAPTRATWRITPALGTEAMFRALTARPRGLGMIALLWRFRHEFRLGRPGR